MKSDSASRIIDDAATPSLKPLRVINPTAWQGKPVPEREWIADGFIPARTVSLLSGEGSTGKSTLAQQLGVARCIKEPWLTILPTPGRTLILSAEDDTDEMHRRLAAICERMGTRFDALADLRLIDLVGEDAVLGSAGKGGVIQPTRFFERMCAEIADFRADLVVIDALADAFAGNENDRQQARQFVGLLKRPARDLGCAFLCIAHPSLTGIASGTGSSGSTHWANSVRSRMVFEHAKASDGSSPDPDLRTLRVNKSNYGPAGRSVTLRWERGIYVPVAGQGSLDRQATERLAESTFLDLLDLFDATGQAVTAVPSPTYAPSRFAEHPKANGISKCDFAAAMQRLLAAGTIKIAISGPPSRQRTSLERVASCTRP
jgi:RecA-family ATPase